MTLVAGVDCSTQSTKVVVCDADTGEVVPEGAPRWKREGTVVQPDPAAADYYRRVRQSYAAVLGGASELLTR